jgi:hypothetical protein
MDREPEKKNLTMADLVAAAEVPAAQRELIEIVKNH